MPNAIKMMGLQICMMLSLWIASTHLYASADPFLGEVKWFAGNYAPRGWAFCDGQLLPIDQNTALFSLLGTIYGGDGRTTFALPDMRGRASMHPGTGPGLSTRRQGQKSGVENVSLNQFSLPSHSHGLRADSTGGDDVKPDDRFISNSGRLLIFDSTPTLTGMHNSAIANTGGSQSHNNVQPFVILNCIIALQGTYPSRN